MDVMEWKDVKNPFEITHRKFNSHLKKGTYCHLKTPWRTLWVKIPPPVVWKGAVTNVCTLGGKLPSRRQTNSENMKTIETRDIKCWGSWEIMPHISISSIATLSNISWGKNLHSFTKFTICILLSIRTLSTFKEKILKKISISWKLYAQIWNQWNF